MANLFGIFSTVVGKILQTHLKDDVAYNFVTTPSINGVNAETIVGSQAKADAAQAAAQGAGQPVDATLTALAGLATGADKVPYFTGADTANQATFTAAARSLVAAVDAAAQRAVMGLGTAAVRDDTYFDVAGSAATAEANAKGYTDTKVKGLALKDSVNAATTAPLPAVAYANGASGSGATLTGAGFGALGAMDGQTLSVADRLLVKDQALAKQNGIYIVTALGGIASLFVLTRADDADISADIQTGMFTFVEYGTTLAGTEWALTSATPLVVGTDAQSFTQLSAPGAAALRASNLSDLTGPTSTVRANIGVSIGSQVQAWDADLDAIAALTSAADKLPYSTGAQTWSLADLTSFGRSLIDDADASTARSTLGLAIGSAVQAFSSVLSTYAGIDPSANVQTLLGAANFAAFRTSLGVAIGSAVQAWDADLDAIAALTSAANKMPYSTGAQTWALTDLSAFIRTLLDDADAATARATLGAGTGNGDAVTSGKLSQFASTSSAELFGIISDELAPASGLLTGGLAWADYTPTITGPATVPVFSTNVGRWCQIGKTVFVDVYLTGDGGTDGSGTGQINIALPANTGGSSPAAGDFLVGSAVGNGLNYLLLGTLGGGVSTIQLRYYTSISATANLTGNSFPNGFRAMRLQFNYEV